MQNSFGGESMPNFRIQWLLPNEEIIITFYKVKRDIYKYGSVEFERW